MNQIVAQWLTANISKFDIKDAAENICTRSSIMVSVLWEDIDIQSQLMPPSVCTFKSED